MSWGKKEVEIKYKKDLAKTKTNPKPNETKNEKKNKQKKTNQTKQNQEKGTNDVMWYVILLINKWSWSISSIHHSPLPLYRYRPNKTWPRWLSESYKRRLWAEDDEDDRFSYQQERECRNTGTPFAGVSSASWVLSKEITGIWTKWWSAGRETEML